MRNLTFYSIKGVLLCDVVTAAGSMAVKSGKGDSNG
jgi:hypothetical protein